MWTLGPRLGLEPELVRATAVMLLALPGIALYRVANGLSRGMAVMHHDIYSRGLTESLATTAALVVAVVVRPAAARAGSGRHRRHAVRPAASRSAWRGDCTCPRRARLPRADLRGLVPTLIRASAPIAAYDLIGIVVMQIDVIMLGLYVGYAPGLSLETLGIYAAAGEVATGLRKISQIFSPIFAPVVARQIAAGEVSQAAGSYGYLARWMLAVLLPAVAVLALSGGAIMTIFGESFRSGGSWTAILGIAVRAQRVRAPRRDDSHGGAPRTESAQLGHRLGRRGRSPAPADSGLRTAGRGARHDRPLCDSERAARCGDLVALPLVVAVAAR